jgi:hypothetical protein
MRLDMASPYFELPADVLTAAGRAHFPEIVLYERHWGAYIMLLGMTQRAPEIARALVWMRALGVNPGKRTLSVALAFWSEVSVQPPLIAQMVGRKGDQYLKLVAWLREWCKDVPEEHAVGAWRAWIGRVKKQRRETAEKGRLMEDTEIWTV